jgi:hypothetical protein
MFKAVLLVASIISNIDQYWKLLQVIKHFADKANKKHVIQTDQGFKVKPAVGAPAVLANLTETVAGLEANYMSYTK